MSHKQSRLIAAIKDAMEAQGITMTELARAAGTTVSAVSQAMGGKMDMREERWRMICENLALSYDEVIADLTTAQNINDKELACGEKPACPAPVVDDKPSILERKTSCEQLAMENMVLAAYAAKHLQDDIRNGMDISLRSLVILLDAVKPYIGKEHDI